MGYILLIILSVNAGGGHNAISQQTIEFKDLKACEQAALKVLETQLGRISTKTFCLSKKGT